MKNGRVPVEDDVTTEIITIAGGTTLEAVKISMNKYLQTSVIPDSWHNAQVILLHKKVDNFCPISLPIQTDKEHYKIFEYFPLIFLGKVNLLSLFSTVHYCRGLSKKSSYRTLKFIYTNTKILLAPKSAFISLFLGSLLLSIPFREKLLQSYDQRSSSKLSKLGNSL